MMEVAPVDGEGFPTAGPPVRLHAPDRDQESGEVVRSSVIMLRDPVEPLNLSLRSLCNGLPQGSLTRPFSLPRDEEFFNGLTIGGGMSVRLRPGRLVYHGTAAPLLQKCVYLQRGQPVSTVLKPRLGSDPAASILSCEPYKAEPFFRIPAKCLPASHTEQPARDPKVVCVSIWEEFFFGQSVLDKYDSNAPTRKGITEKIKEGLGQFLPTIVIDVVMYAVYFITYFGVLRVYNDFVSLICYILLSKHLNLHMKAHRLGCKLEFTGSLFQGPLYALTRNWCDHCHHQARATVFTNHMKKMKADILYYQEKTKRSGNKKQC